MKVDCNNIQKIDKERTNSSFSFSKTFSRNKIKENNIKQISNQENYFETQKNDEKANGSEKNVINLNNQNYK